jgi:ABC-type transport system involved in cytochrome c biogenesis permease subunit
VLIYRKVLSRIEATGIVSLAFTLSLIVFLFSDKVKFPSPYLRTIWYPLHVPLSFASYAFWVLAGSRAVSLLKRDEKIEDAVFIQDMCRNGFIYFTIAMIFGGIWGYLAWGSYFMWDPKILWSVILWFFYGNLIHLDNFLSFKKAKPHLYILGVILIFITFIGTGFFTRSIHRF